MLEAEEKQCRAKHTTLWNNSIHQASLLIKYWIIQNLNKTKNHNVGKQLNQIFHQLSDDQKISIQATTASIKTNLRNAIKAKQQLYHDMKQRHESKQKQHTKADAKFYGINTKQAETKAKSTNITKRLFSYLQTVYIKSKGRKVSTIKVPDNNSQEPGTSNTNIQEWRCVTDPIEITQVILQRNITHFGQADKTPFAKPPLTTIFNNKDYQILIPCTMEPSCSWIASLTATNYLH